MCSIWCALRPAFSSRRAPSLETSKPLRGYRKGLRQPGPALLFENRTRLRPYAEPGEDKAEKFWDEINGCRRRKPPARIRKALRNSLPKGATDIRFCQIDRKGGGSLGRARFAAVAKWRGGLVVREAKALVPSAWTWAQGPATSGKSNFLALARGEYRAPDPFLHVEHRFILRRISADSNKIELGDDAGRKLHLNLLEAMGFDIASIHVAGVKRVGTIEVDLRKRKRGWLHAAASRAAEKVRRDYREWTG